VSAFEKSLVRLSTFYDTDQERMAVVMKMGLEKRKYEQQKVSMRSFQHLSRADFVNILVYFLKNVTKIKALL